jgi:hypothetical protein
MKLSDHMPDAKRMSDLSDSAFRVYVEARCFCSSRLTDGRLTARQAAQLCTRNKDRDELIEAGLWDELEDGTIVDAYYLLDNPLRSKVEADRQLAAIRAQRHRNGERNAVTNGAQEPLRTGEQTAHVTDPEAELPPHTPLSEQESDSGSDEIQDPEFAFPDKPLENLTGSARVAQKRVRKARRAAWKRVPEDWNPKPEHEQIANEEGVDFDRELSKYRDWHFARSRVDPDATFRNWLREAGERSRRNGTRPVSRADSQLQRQLARVAELEAEERRQ